MERFGTLEQGGASAGDPELRFLVSGIRYGDRCPIGCGGIALQISRASLSLLSRIPSSRYLEDDIVVHGPRGDEEGVYELNPRVRYGDAAVQPQL